ncbi:MAG: tetratricopeptide repeat protein, partial [Nitrosopumilaceae archaeon]
IEPLHKEAIHNKGTVLINLNRTREALDCFNEFLVARPQDSNALFNKGLCLESFGDKTKAIECFNEALRYGINDLTILNKIGGQFTLYGDPNRAIKECFQKILNEDENNIDAMYGMYLAFTKLGNKIESETWHQKYLNARTNSASD